MAGGALVSGLGIDHMDISDIAFWRKDGSAVVWEDVSGCQPMTGPDGAKSGGGSHDGALLIRIGVDSQFTTVHGQDGDRNIIAKAISELQFLLDALDATYLAGQSRGRCLENGNWGRCCLEDEHGGDCEFPTEADYANEVRAIEAAARVRLVRG